MKIIRLVLTVLLLAIGALSLSSCGYDTKRVKIEEALVENAKSISGVSLVNTHVNSNTSGNFMTVKITADNSYKSELERILQEYLSAILSDPRVEDGTLGVSVFSPDEETNVGPSDLGYSGLNTTRKMREFFG